MATVNLQATSTFSFASAAALTVPLFPEGEGCGYGDENFSNGGYGDNDFGYGSPCSIVAVFADTQRIFHDLGGELCTLTSAGGTFPIGIALAVRVNGVDAYSGVRGQGNDVFAISGGNQIQFVVPNLFGVLGPVDVEVDDPGGTQTFEGVIEIVRYTHRSNTTLSKLRYPRKGAGPYFLPIAMPRKL
jgi:hypothetical protein